MLFVLKSVFFIVCMLNFAVYVMAENLANGGDAEASDISLFSNNVERSEVAPHSGKYCYRLDKINVYASSSAFIPVDPNPTSALEKLIC